MLGILRAYARALRSLVLPPVLAHFLWPVLVAAGAWLAAGLAFWDKLAWALAGSLHFARPLTSATGQATQVAVATSLKVALYLMSIPLALVTAVLLLEIVALPFIIDRIAKQEYPDLERRHGGSQWQSVRNTLVSLAIAALVAALTLPLWLLPGAGVVVSLSLSAWLNYRSFRYDVLMNHADAQELSSLPRVHRAQLLLMAAGAGLLTLVPVVNLLSVPFSGLSFAHYLLHALARARDLASADSARPV
jgi:CysZ protein